MKNLIIVLSLFFALGANAQAKRSKTTAKAPERTEVATPQITAGEYAQKNVDNIMTFTPVDTHTQGALKELFLNKYNQLTQDGKPSDEKKRAIAGSMEYRLSLLLDQATLTRIKSNTQLYNSLIN